MPNRATLIERLRRMSRFPPPSGLEEWRREPAHSSMSDDDVLEQEVEVLLREEDGDEMEQGQEPSDDELIQEAEALLREEDGDEMEQGQEASALEAGSRQLTPREMADFLIDEEEHEEGEIRELPPWLDLDFWRSFGNHDDDDRYIPRESSNCCPYCRTPAFFPGLIDCHVDTLQLIRVRLRLTDLAYCCLDFTPTPQELKARQTTMDFLARRHADNLANGEREIPLTRSNCRHLFKQAHLMLFEKAFVYCLEHELQGADFVATAQFGLYFKHSELQDHQIPYFFDPNPAYSDSLTGYTMAIQGVVGLSIPKGVFQRLRLGSGIEPHSYIPEDPSANEDIVMS
ncbi:MAG: hypothetical protein Q9200_000298 [Gallowayella weberi]